MLLQYHAKVSWQSLETRTLRLDPRNLKASSIKALHVVQTVLSNTRFKTFDQTKKLHARAMRKLLLFSLIVWGSKTESFPQNVSSRSSKNSWVSWYVILKPRYSIASRIEFQVETVNFCTVLYKATFFAKIIPALTTLCLCMLGLKFFKLFCAILHCMSVFKVYVH